MDSSPRIVTDVGTGRPVLISPGRLQRPHTTGADDAGADNCPFCQGNESETPPESDAIRTENSAANCPGWSARAFPNLFPACALHEVIAEDDRHTTHPSQFRSVILHHNLQLYRRRIAAMEAADDVVATFLFKNVGAASGASIAHNHSQLLGLPMIPPRLLAEAEAYATHGCFHCDEIARAEAEDRVVARTDQHIVLCPTAPKLSYETWLLPLDHHADFMSAEHDADLVSALQTLYKSVDAAFPNGAFNHFLHRLADRDFHWHLELQPRVGMMAALEIGGDMYINSITPQASADTLRGGS